MSKTLYNPYGFIYITTNHINGRRYIGQKKFDEKKEWRAYLGSGLALKNAIKKYGKENFSKNIIYVAYSKEDLDKAEKGYIEFFDAVDSVDYYNIGLGGEGNPIFSSKKFRLNHSHIVYCIDTNEAYLNAPVASQYINENPSTIYGKCINFHNGLPNVRNGMHWCFYEDIWKTFPYKSIYSATPVIDLITYKIYPSICAVKRDYDGQPNKRWILTLEQAKSNRIQSSHKHFMILKDFLTLYECTNKKTLEALNLDYLKKWL